MTSRWSNREQVGSSEVFETLHDGLTVELIATPRDDFMACHPGEAVSELMKRNQEPYDFLPVIDEGADKAGNILGLFHATPFFDASSLDGYVKDWFSPLSEEFLIGADASILAFVKNADSKSCRLVVSGPKIVGLVSLSDLQKLPVRAALFALITGFEITLAEAITAKFEGENIWMGLLSKRRKDKITEEIAKSRHDDAYVNSLLFTQFLDKANIIVKAFELPQSKTQTQEQLDDIRNLRNNLAHANEYASTPQQAKNVCAVVRNLLALKDVIAATYASGPLLNQSGTRQRGAA